MLIYLFIIIPVPLLLVHYSKIWALTLFYNKLKTYTISKHNSHGQNISDHNYLLHHL